MLWFYRFIFGFLEVRFFGNFKEKIFNLAAGNGISFFNTKLTKDGIKTNISVRDFKKLPQILRGSGIRVKILKKRGLPFKLKINQKRLGILAGIILSIVFFELMSGFIWIIDVTGNKAVPTAEILSACEKVGIVKGIKISDVDTKTAREKLLLNIDSLAWASLNIEGCKLTVNVSEADKKEDNSCICNLKSKADGIVKKIEVTSGNTLVKIGDTVKKGDVVVSGVLEKLTGTEFVHSSGEIIAETKRSVTVSGDYIKKEEKENGEVKRKRVLSFFGIKIPLFIGGETKKYKESITAKDIKLFGVSLPITVYEKEFRFTEIYEKKLTAEELKTALYEEIKKTAQNEGLTDFEMSDLAETKSENGITLSAIITATENIVYRETMLINKENEIF